ncbi:hypothetical protein ACFL35_17320 [Candidatus Riflebacteria bacterium]
MVNAINENETSVSTEAPLEQEQPTEANHQVAPEPIIQDDGNGTPDTVETVNDMFSAKNLLLSPVEKSILTGESEILLVGFRKPTSEEYFRVCPEQGYQLGPILFLKGTDEEMGLNLYLPNPVIRKEVLSSYKSSAKYFNLFLCVSLYSNEYFIMPISAGRGGSISPHSKGEGCANKWTSSNYYIKDLATKDWCRRASDMEKKRYEVYSHTDEIQPAEPKWPQDQKTGKPIPMMGKDGLLSKAIGPEKIIDSLKHPMITALGKKLHPGNGQ